MSDELAKLFEGKNAKQINEIIAQAEASKATLRSDAISKLEGKINEILLESDLSIDDLFATFEDEVKKYAINELNIGSSSNSTTKVPSKKNLPVPNERKQWHLLSIDKKEFLLVDGRGAPNKDILKAITSANGKETSKADIVKKYSVKTITGQEYLDKVKELEIK